MAQTSPPGEAAEGLAQERGTRRPMSAIQRHDAKFLTILWDEKTRVIGIDWKETTANRFPTRRQPLASLS